MILNFRLKLSSKILIISGLLGTLLLGGGIFLGFIVVPYFVTEKIWEMKVLKEHTEQWDLFLKIPFPFTFKVHIFDVQNPDEVLQGETPVVKETGPYVYKVYKWNSDIEWNDTDTISYYTYMRFEFDKEASSPLSEEDTLTILNTPYNSMLLTVEATQPSALTMMDGVSPGVFGENDGLFIKVKVKDYLFDGLRMCVNMGKDGGFAAGMVCKQIVAQLEKTKNMRIVNNTILFANIHYKNNTHLGRFTIKSGINNRKETGNLILYNELPYTSTWLGENSLCNKIRGVTTIFPVSVEKNMVFEAFAEDVCRAMSLQYEKEETVKNVLGYRFVVPNDTFSVARKENQCFCVNKSRSLDGGFGCLKDGLVDLTTCTGAPVLMSFPHLLYADREYTSSVKGLKPNKLQHETFIILEPISGYPLQLAQRIQFNMFIRPIEGVVSMENVSKALLPIIWVEESTILGDEYMDMLDTKLFRTLKVVNIVTWTTVIIGLAAVLLTFFMFVYIKAP